ncbi:MAG TPA: hypothetical protein VJ728_10920 [Candidatus Binataceae bacterium]|nr:hypothetical protein [Candidatus Binataceae bacterium]
MKSRYADLLEQLERIGNIFLRLGALTALCLVMLLILITATAKTVYLAVTRRHTKPKAVPAQ